MDEQREANDSERELLYVAVKRLRDQCTSMLNGLTPKPPAPAEPEGSPNGD